MNINDAKRIVFKFGTNVLRNDDKEISLSRVYSFIEEISKLHSQGKEIIVVTSGAVGLGSKKLNVDSSESLSIKQACAAVGQCQLMSIYEDGFGVKVANGEVIFTVVQPEGKGKMKTSDFLRGIKNPASLVSKILE